MTCCHSIQQGPMSIWNYFCFFAFFLTFTFNLAIQKLLPKDVTNKRNVPARMPPTGHTPWRNQKHAGFLVPSKQRARQPQKHTEGDLEVSTEEVEGAEKQHGWWLHALKSDSWKEGLCVRRMDEASDCFAHHKILCSSCYVKKRQENNKAFNISLTAPRKIKYVCNSLELQTK